MTMAGVVTLSSNRATRTMGIAQRWMTRLAPSTAVAMMDSRVAENLWLKLVEEAVNHEPRAELVMVVQDIREPAGYRVRRFPVDAGLQRDQEGISVSTRSRRKGERFD